MIEHCAQFVDEFNKDSEVVYTKEDAITNMKFTFQHLNVGKYYKRLCDILKQNQFYQN